MFAFRKEHRRGQAVVEFALVLPVFLLLLLAAVEFGRAYLKLHILTNAAREGARMGMLPDKVEQDVYDTTSEFLEAAGMRTGSWQTVVTVTDKEGVLREGGLAQAQEGDRVQVSVSYELEVLSGTIIPGWEGTVNLDSDCVFRHE